MYLGYSGSSLIVGETFNQNDLLGGGEECSGRQRLVVLECGDGTDHFDYKRWCRFERRSKTTAFLCKCQWETKMEAQMRTCDCITSRSVLPR